MMPFSQVQLFPEQASTVAPKTDALFWFIFAVSAFFTVLIAWLVIYFGIKYRRRSPDEIPRPREGGNVLEIAWTVAPALIGLVIFFWSARLYFSMYRPPDDALPVHVVAKQWMWKVQHPGGQREINELHVPRGQPVKLILVSEQNDVIHSFYVPAFRIKQDALPGRRTSIWFEATKTGTYDLFCAEYCGTDHSRMRGRVVVMEQADYQRWLEEQAEGSAALEGRKLFRKYRCISCHGGGSHPYAPLLENLKVDTEVRLQDGRTVPADDEYIRKSIYEPKADIVAGYRPIMPSFQGQISEDEVLQLIAFIRSLKTGQTPTRVEETEAPIDESGLKK